MRHVEQAEIRPHHCVGYPQLGHHPTGGFIDTGVDSRWDDRHYVSVAFIREVARKFPDQIGLVARDELTLALAERDAVQKELEDVQAELAECNRELDAIHVLRGKGYQPEKRRGRPPVKKAA